MKVRYIGTVEATRTSAYKVEDKKVEGGEASVAIYTWDADGSTNAHCMACDAYKCQHCDAAMREHLLRTKQNGS